MPDTLQSPAHSNSDNDEEMNAGQPPKGDPTPSPEAPTFPNRDESLALEPNLRDDNPHQLAPAFTPSDPNDLLDLSLVQRNIGGWETAVIPVDILLENV